MTQQCDIYTRPHLLPVTLLLPLVRIESSIICSLWVAKMSLRTTLRVMHILLRSTYTASNTTPSSTEPGATIETLTLRTLSSLVLSLSLRLSLHLRLLSGGSSATGNHHAVFRRIWLIWGLGRTSWSTCIRRRYTTRTTSTLST